MMAAPTVAAKVGSRTGSVWSSPPPSDAARRQRGWRASEGRGDKAGNITTVTRVASDDNGNGDGGKSDGNGDKGAGRATTRVMAVATTVAAMRVASDEEGEGGKAMEMGTRLAGEQRRGQ
jgi:hypothetical protein